MADRGVTAVTRDRLLDLGAAIVGPRHTGAKLFGALVVLVIIGLLIPVPARVTAGAEVKATVTRTIVAPYTGYLATVTVEPGSAVEEGQVLATMDTSDLTLELAETQARYASLSRPRHDDAHPDGDQGKVRGLEAQQSKKHRRRLNMLKDHLSRSQIRSPVTGVVGQGDLRQFVRARVDPTQPLFEVVSREQRAVAYVEEADVQRVKAKQEGYLVSRSRPGAKVPGAGDPREPRGGGRTR